MKPLVTDEMVSRFLSWRLPDDFAPDCGISFKRYHYFEASADPHEFKPTGTNLLHASQARAMLEHVLGTAKGLLEHNGCGHGTQVEQLTVRLNPGDKVVLVMGPYSAALAKTQSPE